MIPANPYQPPTAPLDAPSLPAAPDVPADLRWLPVLLCGLVVAAGWLAVMCSVAGLLVAGARGHESPSPSTWDRGRAVAPCLLLVATGIAAMRCWATGRWRRAVAATVCLLPIGSWIALTLTLA